MSPTLVQPEVESEVRLGVDLPTAWDVVTIGELFEIQQGKALSPEARSGERLRPFLRTANVLWSRLNLTTVDRMDFTDEEAARLSLRPDDLLICEGGEIGRAALWRGEIEGCSYQNHIHRLRPTRVGVNPAYYMYWMRAALLQLGLYGGAENRTTIPNLSKGRLSRLPVPVPSPDEQSAIVGVLTRLQHATESGQRVLASARALRRALTRHLLSHGPTALHAAEQPSLKESPVGQIPAHWRVAPLGEICERPQYGLTASASARPIGPKFLRITDLTDDGVDWDSVPYASQADGGVGTSLARYTLSDGDIVIARIGATTGKSYLVVDPPNAVFASYLIRVRAGADVLPEFLALTMTSEIYWSQVNAAKEGRLKLGVNIPVLTGLVLPIPPMDEQKQIVHVLRAVDRKIRAETMRESALTEMFDGLLPELVTGRRRVSASDAST